MTQKHTMICQCCSNPIAEFNKLETPLTPEQFQHAHPRLKSMNIGPFDVLHRLTGRIQCYMCKRIAHTPEGYIKLDTNGLYYDPETNKRMVYNTDLKSYEVHPDDYENTFKCDHCDYTTPYKVALVGHMKKHKGKK